MSLTFNNGNKNDGNKNDVDMMNNIKDRMTTFFKDSKMIKKDTTTIGTSNTH